MQFVNPSAGNYECWFSSYVKSSNSSGAISVAIYYSTTQVAASVREVAQTKTVPISSHAKVTVNGTQNISVYWSYAGNGTGTCYERTSTIAKVG